MGDQPLEVFRRLTHGLYVVGGAHEGQRDAFTAAWVTQVSFEPLLVIVSVNPAHSSFPIVVASGAFAVSILRRGQLELARHFGTQSGREVDKFADQRWHSTPGGSPVLSDALGYLDCRVAGRYPAGDHELLLGRVVGGEVFAPDELPMTYAETGNLDGSAALFPPTF